MIKSFNGDINSFEYVKLSPEEQEKRGILGRLKGIICDFKRPTRNHRLYGERLWDKLFADPIVQEKLQNRCLFGEIEHPLDGRTAIDPQKIAICLAEEPKKDNDGHLLGVFDILNTPCGMILKTLLDYGTTVAISSRGTGDLFTNSNGIEEVDPDSYEFTGWDIVFTPGVKEARLQTIAESIGQSPKVSLVESLNKLVEEAKDEDKEIMKSTIDSLNVADDVKEENPENISEVTDVEEENPDEKQKIDDSEVKEDDVKNNQEQTKVEIPSGYDCYAFSSDNFSGLAGSFTTNDEDSAKNWALEQLPDTSIRIIDRKNGQYLEISATEEDMNGIDDTFSWISQQFINAFSENAVNAPSDDGVSNIEKEPEIDEVVKNESIMLEELQKALVEKAKVESEVVSLNERLSVCYAKESQQNELIESLKNDSKNSKELVESLNNCKKLIENQKQAIAGLMEQLKKSESKTKSLTEDMHRTNKDTIDKDRMIESLQTKLSEAGKSIEDISAKYNQVNECLSQSNKTIERNQEDYTKKLTESMELVEKYKKVATRAVDKYINSQAVKLGLTTNEIKNKLPSNYSFNDIDTICESLKAEKISMNLLPFRNPQRLSENMNIQIKSQKKEPILESTNKVAFDDDVDDSLLHLAGM